VKDQEKGMRHDLEGKSEKESHVLPKRGKGEAMKRYIDGEYP